MGLEQLGVGEVGQAFQTAAIAKANQPANDLMGRALRYLRAIRIFHQRGGIEKSLVKPFLDPVGAERCPLDDHRRQLQTRLDRVKRVEERLFVLLQVAVVGQRKPFDEHQERRQASHNSGRAAAD